MITMDGYYRAGPITDHQVKADEALEEAARQGQEVDNVLVCFFFSSRRRHTRLQGDWSSDVCSSDLSGRRHTRLQGDWSSDVCSSDLSRRRHTRLQGDWSSDVCSSD